MKYFRKKFKLILFIFCLLLLTFLTYEFNTLYDNVPLWDTIMHSLTGFFMVILVIIVYKLKKVILPKFVIMILAFCFSLSISTLFEIFEYSMDKIFKLDMQKDMFITNIYTTKYDKDAKEIQKIKNINKTIIYYNNKKFIINGYLDIGINDTMKDLIVNLFGSIIGIIYFYFDLKNEKIIT